GFQQQRYSVIARDVSRTQAHIEHIYHAQILLPERPRKDQLVMQEGGIIDQQIEPAMLRSHLLEQAGYLGIVGMIATNRDPTTAGRCHQLGRLFQITAQDLAVDLLLPQAAERPSGDIYGHPGTPQGYCDPPAHAPAGPRDYCNIRSCGWHAVAPVRNVQSHFYNVSKASASSDQTIARGAPQLPVTATPSPQASAPAAACR